MALHSFILLAAVVLFLPFVSSAQIINEEPFPILPYSKNTSSILVDGKGFYIAGRSGYEFTNPFFDTWGSISQPYFIVLPNSKNKKVVLFPAFEESRFFGLGGNQNKISLSSVRTTADSFFVAWSNIVEKYTDVGPFVYNSLPEFHLSKYENDS